MSAYSDVVLADSPIVYYRLGEPSGTTADNAEGTAARDGTYVNTPTLGVAGLLTGDADTAVTVNGSTQYIYVADQAALDFGNGPLTYELWFKNADTAKNQWLMAKGTQTAGLYYTATTGVIAWRSYGWGPGATSSIGIADTNRHHIVGTKDTSNNWLLYIDGVDRTTYAGVTDTASSATDLYIGTCSDLTDYADGTLDEVAVYNTLLSPTRIAAHYTAGTTVALLAVPGITQVTMGMV